MGIVMCMVVGFVVMLLVSDLGAIIAGGLGLFNAIGANKAQSSASNIAQQQMALSKQLADLGIRAYNIQEPALISGVTGQLQRNNMMEQGLPSLLNYAIGRMGSSSAAYGALPGLRTQSGQVSEGLAGMSDDQALAHMRETLTGGDQAAGQPTSWGPSPVVGPGNPVTPGAPQPPGGTTPPAGEPTPPAEPLVPAPPAYAMSSFPSATGAISDPAMENLVMERARTDIERQGRSAMGSLVASLGDRFGLASSAPTALAAGLSSLAATGQEGMMNARLGLVQQAQALESQRYSDLVQTMLGIGGLSNGQLNMAGQNAGMMTSSALQGMGNAGQTYQGIMGALGQSGTGYGQLLAQLLGGGQQQPLTLNLNTGGGVTGGGASSGVPTNQSGGIPWWQLPVQT
jgi:hypothetical protein